MSASDGDLGRQALETLRENDHGGYAVPTQGLYPFQWNWDSAIHALGWQAAGEEERGWREVETLLASEWENGLLPHIVFHEPSPSYFPGPDEWGTAGDPPTSAISQPPLVAYAALQLYLNSGDEPKARARLAKLQPLLVRHVEWWLGARWDERLQLVFTVHPWESGRDNSPMYDRPLSRVPAVSRPYERRDTSLVDAEQRPHKFEYDRYIYLVDFYKRVGFDDGVIGRESPYKVCDAGLNAVLARAAASVIRIGEIVGSPCPPRIAEKLALLKDGFANLWCEELQTYCGYDLVADELLKVPAAEGFFALFGGVAPAEKAGRMKAEIERWNALVEFGIPGVAPDSPLWEPRRYCRGPAWVIINWLIATGLEEYSHGDTARALKESALGLVRRSGFSEYYDPRDGSPCGGGTFSWTAGLALHWLGLLS